MPITFDNSYARLPGHFFTRQTAQSVPAPQMRAFNTALATQLGLPDMDDATRAAIFSGNTTPDGAEPLAAVYAGHQFGGWNPQLGDGRALLIGEVLDTTGARFDIQLKGSGRTPYSRSGDGRAWLGPVLREYLVSEGMHALGIPTTRALAMVTTGERVMRETALPGAILTRVAASHIRVGTFQYFAARKDTAALQTLVDHVIARHYPQATSVPELLQAVVAAQANLIAAWMQVGFIHGVMNTDNCQVAGETIDYGPCAFMDTYVPGQVYSSIDQQARYAYGNQPEIIGWNLAQLATSLLPLMDDREKAIEEFTEIVSSVSDHYARAWTLGFGQKIGITEAGPDDIALIQNLLTLMAQGQADFTNTFRALSSDTPQDQFTDPAAFAPWAALWRARIADEENPTALMNAVNPAVIPRNHQVEAAIQGAVADDWSKFEALSTTLATPFTAPSDKTLTSPPVADQVVAHTFCGT